MTREDFNIEDIHCQMVHKIQRNNQLLHDIEGGPEDQDILLNTEEHLSGNQAPQVVQVVDEEILCGDMCARPAINWGRGKPLRSVPISNHRNSRDAGQHQGSQSQPVKAMHVPAPQHHGGSKYQHPPASY